MNYLDWRRLWLWSLFEAANITPPTNSFILYLCIVYYILSPAALIRLACLDLATSPEFVWFPPGFVASVAPLCPSKEFVPEQIKSLELIQTEWYKRRHSCQLCPLLKGVKINFIRGDISIWKNNFLDSLNVGGIVGFYPGLGVRFRVWRLAIKRCWYTKSILGCQPSLNYGDNKTITNTLFMGRRLARIFLHLWLFWWPRTKTSSINFIMITSSSSAQVLK